MGNGRKYKKGISVRDLKDINLVFARVVEEDGENQIRFTVTYAIPLKKDRGKVLMEAPELGIKKWICMRSDENNPDAMEGISVEREDGCLKLFSFTKCDTECVKDDICDFLNDLLEEEDEQDY